MANTFFLKKENILKNDHLDNETMDQKIWVQDQITTHHNWSKTLITASNYDSGDEQILSFLI